MSTLVNPILGGWVPKVGIVNRDTQLPVVPVSASKLLRASFVNNFEMGLSGKQPGLLVAVIVPALLSTIVVVARSLSKVKRRPSYISKTGALAAEILLIASVVGFPTVTRQHQ
jgi:hypothetical protein